LKKILTISTFLCFSFIGLHAQHKFSYADSRLVNTFPNPATQAVNFELLNNEMSPLSLRIYNFVGKKVFEFSLTNVRYYLPLDNFSRGLYIYQVRNQYGSIVDSGKFQVVK
jgi:hypothetical protein